MPADELTLLEQAELHIEGRMPWSSNATYLANLVVDGRSMSPRRQARSQGAEQTYAHMAATGLGSRESR